MSHQWEKLLRASPETRPIYGKRLRPSFERMEDRLLLSVVTNNHDSGAGSLRAAIAAAAPGDTIQFSSALLGSTIALSTGELLINKPLTIQGPSGGSPLIISAQQKSRAIHVTTTGAVSISNILIEGGRASIGACDP